MEESQEIEKIIDLLNSLSREEQLDIFRIIFGHERERKHNDTDGSMEHCSSDSSIRTAKNMTM